MYEITLIGNAKEKFKKAAKAKMRERGWKMSDLAEATGRSIGTIHYFFANTNRPQRFLAADIAEALGMDRKDWS